MELNASTPTTKILKSAEVSDVDHTIPSIHIHVCISINTCITKESKLFSEPSESYLPSYRSLVTSMDDLTLRDVTKVCHKGPTITAGNRIIRA